MGSCVFEVADASQESPPPRLERDMAVGARGVERGGSSAGGVEVISEEGARMAWDCLVGGRFPRKGGGRTFRGDKKGGVQPGAAHGGDPDSQRGVTRKRRAGVTRTFSEG